MNFLTMYSLSKGKIIEKSPKIEKNHLPDTEARLAKIKTLISE